MKSTLKKIGSNTVICIGSIMIILGMLGILVALTIAAYEYHWFLGSVVGCVSLMVLGLFLIHIIDDGEN